MIQKPVQRENRRCTGFSFFLGPMNTPTLKQLIEQRVTLAHRPNGHGYFATLCKVCNDHGKKGPRAGFMFDDEAVRYNCFNCGHGASYDPNEDDTMPRKMATVLEAFGIPETDWRAVLFHGLELREGGYAAAPTHKFIDIEPKEVAYPKFFYPLADDPADDFAQYAIEYLASRQIDWKTRPFHLVAKDSHPSNEKWYGRLIIPTFKDDKLIFWQGRDLTGLHTKKYLSPPVQRDNILTGYEHIKQYTKDPLYIVEGWFDAYHLNGVAVYGNKLTANQTTWINKSNRPKVVIPDRQGDGHLLALQALELGWSISTPDIGSCKDVNDAIVKYGELYTRMSIAQNTWSDAFTAKAHLSVYCSG